MCPAPCEYLTPCISRIRLRVCIPLSTPCVYLTPCVSHSVCISYFRLHVCIPLRLYVPLRMCPTLCVFHYTSLRLYLTLCVPFFKFFIPLCVLHFRPQVRLPINALRTADLVVGLSSCRRSRHSLVSVIMFQFGYRPIESNALNGVKRSGKI